MIGDRVGVRILALEPFYGGSHRRFLDRWQALSRHHITLWTLPARFWKWRMRHAGLEFAERFEQAETSESWDLIFCSDMLNLAEFRGLAPAAAALPTVLYFHENQLTYPVRKEEERDRHFAFSNLLSARAADAVWWNSGFHRDDFAQAARDWLRRLPDFQPLDSVDGILAKSSVLPQGIDLPPPRRASREPGPLRILWAARWEFDKNPEAFFAAVGRLKELGHPFRLSVLGERYRRSPEIFDQAQRDLDGHIDHWGYLDGRDAYLEALGRADVVVSTADHEFFGVAVAEAVAAGCRPLLPDRLAYPELIQDLEPATDYLYKSDDELHDRLLSLAVAADRGEPLWPAGARGPGPEAGHRAMARYAWPKIVQDLDGACERVAVAFAALAR